MLGGRLRVVTARVVCRLDILVEPERVPRIVFILQSEEPPEVVAVGGPDPCASLGVQVVDIYFPAREGLHRVRAGAWTPRRGRSQRAYGPSWNDDLAAETTVISLLFSWALGLLSLPLTID